MKTLSLNHRMIKINLDLLCDLHVLIKAYLDMQYSLLNFTFFREYSGVCYYHCQPAYPTP